MRMAVTGGTCKGANLPGLDVCGKTGTVQNPHGRDHSVFMGFAPKEDPKIAICVYVENAGFGAQVAVPLGAMVLERYLRGESDEIETRASKWSDKWLEESPSAFEEEEKLQQLNPDTTLKKPETTAQQSSSSNPIGLPLDREQQQAVLTRPIGDIITRNDIYKG